MAGLLFPIISAAAESAHTHTHTSVKGQEESSPVSVQPCTHLLDFARLQFFAQQLFFSFSQTQVSDVLSDVGKPCNYYSFDSSQVLRVQTRAECVILTQCEQNKTKLGRGAHEGAPTAKFRRSDQTQICDRCRTKCIR